MTEPSITLSRRDAFGAVALGAAAISAGLGESPAQAQRPAVTARPGEGPFTTPKDAIVETTSGPVQGYRLGRTYGFKGVPFGADCSGERRFLPAAAPEPWTEPRLALAYGAACPQFESFNGMKSPLMRFVVPSARRFQSEDCLNLNVWTPALGAGERRPVVVWLHGGGYQSGSNSELPEYDGTALAERGLVVVGLNHRVGVFGFLDLSGWDERYASSGNVGMLDLVRGLEWVRDNIARFGGDPARVTIFGQSGGGGKVSTLMAMPAARGLFHRAMVMSGSDLAAASPATMRTVAADVMQAASLAPGDIAGLARLDSAALLAAGQGGVEAYQKASGTRALVWQPVLNARDLPADWTKGAPAISAHLPLIVGNTRDEMRAFGLSLDDAALAARLKKDFGDRAGTIAASLRATFPQATPADIYIAATAMPWREAAVEQARLQHDAGKAPVWNYWYTHPSPLLGGTIGAPHGSDVAPAFANVDLQPALTGLAPEAYRISELFSGALVAFATSGDPSTPALAWPRFDPASVPTMMWDGAPRAVSDPAGEARRAIAAVRPGGPF